MIWVALLSAAIPIYGTWWIVSNREINVKKTIFLNAISGYSDDMASFGSNDNTRAWKKCVRQMEKQKNYEQNSHEMLVVLVAVVER